MKRILTYLIIFSSILITAQSKLEFESGKRAVITFQSINNLIFIPVQVNGVQLTFLLDTGVTNTILFSVENKDINLRNAQKTKFSGLGGQDEVEGLASDGNTMVFGKNLIDRNHLIYAILDEDFNFSSHIGIPVNGIIGYEFFKDHPVKIDFIKKKITVFANQKDFEKETKKAEEFEISIENNKPYIMAQVQIAKESESQKMLIDLGNGDPIWVFPSLIKGFVYNRPNIDDYLGRGFNGDIFGKRSRIRKFSLGKFEFDTPLIAMPDEFSIQHINMVKDRKGSVGIDIIRRFTSYFDYPNQKMYLKKNSRYDDPFHINMSGLDIKHDGMVWQKDEVELPLVTRKASSTANESQINLGNRFQYKFALKPEFSVAGSRKDSPAYLAGARPGDVLVSINGKATNEMTLNKINELFKSEENKKINLKILRNSIPMEIVFVLEDPIPYQEN